MKFALFLVPVLLVACGGAEKADTVDVPPPAAPAAPTQSQPTAVSPATAEPTKAPEVDAGVLAKAALTLEDMPAGWTVSTPSKDDDDDDICGAEQKLTPKNSVDADFKQSDFGPFFATRLSLFSLSDAKKAMEDIRDVFKGCTTWTSGDNPPAVYTISPLSFPRLADDTFAVRVSTTGVPLFGTMQVDVVYVRRGPVVSVLGYVALGPAAAGTSPLEDLARKADAKLQKAGVR